MMTPVPFAVAHLAQLDIQPAQRAHVHVLPAAHLARLVGPWSWTAMVADTPVLCGGILANDFGAGTLWSFVAPAAGPELLAITRFVRRMILLAGLRRLEATSAVQFAAGCRWLELLGFAREGVMRRYGLDGADHILYARCAP